MSDFCCPETDSEALFDDCWLLLTQAEMILVPITSEPYWIKLRRLRLRIFHIYLLYIIQFLS
jgi:hypothetical protein